MKYLKIIGLLAVAAAALMAFAASASATTLTSPTGTTYTGEIVATSEGHAVLKNPEANITIECSSQVKGNIEKHGAGATVSGKITSLVWGFEKGSYNGNCTNGWHVTTVALGELELHWSAEHEGTVTAKNATVSATRFGITCNYAGNNLHIGTLTDSHKANGATTAEPSTATMHIKASIPPHSGSSIFCGTSNSTWEGSYEVTTPDRLYIDK